MKILISKISFLIRKPKIILIVGRMEKTISFLLFEVLKNFFDVDVLWQIPNFWPKKEILIINLPQKKLKGVDFFLKNSPFGVLVVSHLSSPPPEGVVFVSPLKRRKKILNLAKKLSAQNYLILNFDDETTREIDDLTNLKTLKYGFSQRAEIFASDIRLNFGTNFKLNFEDKSIPVWLEGVFGKDQIYSALAVFGVCFLLNLNLVKVSQILKQCQFVERKKVLVEGIKGARILDDTDSKEIFEIIESLEILGKIQGFKRKIAVLADVLGLGKYELEDLEALGEKVAKNADFLFTLGEKAKFIGKGAFENGMESEKIFNFDSLEELKENLKNFIKEGDLILVEGSKNFKMKEIVSDLEKK